METMFYSMKAAKNPEIVWRFCFKGVDLHLPPVIPHSRAAGSEKKVVFDNLLVVRYLRMIAVIFPLFVPNFFVKKFGYMERVV